MFENLKIEKNIPIPENARKSRGLWKHIADSLEVGDSVFIDNPPKNAKGDLQVMSRLYGYKPKKFIARAEKDGARIWRTA